MTSAQLTGRHRLAGDGIFTRRRLALTSAMVAAGFAGWLGATVDDQPSPAQSTNAAAPVVALPAASESTLDAPAAGAQPAPREFQRTGQILAVSGDAMTTTAAGGETTTYRITPQTNQITVPGATAFAPKQSVVVLGVVHDGVAVATTIAHERAVGPDGPPMDYQLPV